MDKQTKESSKISMGIIAELVGKFYNISYDEKKNIIVIPFIGYEIVVKVRKEQS